MLSHVVLGIKELINSSNPLFYVKDLRRVMVYDGRKCRYPRNYDKIIKFGKIVKKRGSLDLIKDKDKEKNLEFQLIYGGYQFDLCLVRQIRDRCYFTIDFLVNKNRYEVDEYREFYEPFGFKKRDLDEDIPIFEVQKVSGLKCSSFALVGLPVITVNEKYRNNKEDKVCKTVDSKGRNGELLYVSDYIDLRSINFFEIRDLHGNLEIDKSLISIPIVFFVGLVKICTRVFFVPLKLGEYLIGRQNQIAKIFGYFLFIPAMVAKGLLSLGSNLFKAVILLFVADKEKYGNVYWTIWKCQLQECWKEIKGDFLVIKKCRRFEPPEKKKDLDHNQTIVGTWKELDFNRYLIERKLEDVVSGKINSTDFICLEKRSVVHLKNKRNEIVVDDSSCERGDVHVNKVLSRRNLLRNSGIRFFDY